MKHASDIDHSSQPIPRPASGKGRHSTPSHVQRSQWPKPPPKPPPSYHVSSGISSGTHCSRSSRHRAAAPKHSVPGSVMTRSEFEFCRQSLKLVIHRCSDTEYLHWSSIVSCLLHCMRPLHQSELIAILSLVIDTTIETAQAGISLEWLRSKCRELLSVNATGLVQFAHPLFRKFLFSCPVRGVDRTHKLLAKACLLQLKVDDRRSCGGVSSVAVRTPFMDYASQYWQDHYRIVQRTSPGLTTHVHRMLQKWLSVPAVNVSGTSAAQTPEDADLMTREALTICKTLDFDVLGHAYSQSLGLYQRTSQSHLPHAENANVDSAYQALDALHIGDTSDSDLETLSDEWVML